MGTGASRARGTVAGIRTASLRQGSVRRPELPDPHPARLRLARSGPRHFEPASPCRKRAASLMETGAARSAERPRTRSTFTLRLRARRRAPHSAIGAGWSGRGPSPWSRSPPPSWSAGGSHTRVGRSITPSPRWSPLPRSPTSPASSSALEVGTGSSRRRSAPTRRAASPRSARPRRAVRSFRSVSTI